MSLLVSVLPAPDSPVTFGGRGGGRGRAAHTSAGLGRVGWERQLCVCHTNLGCCLLLPPAGGSCMRPHSCSPGWPVPCPLSASSCTRHWQWHTRVAAAPGHHHCCMHPSPASHTALWCTAGGWQQGKGPGGGTAVRKDNLHSLLDRGRPHCPCCCCCCCCCSCCLPHTWQRLEGVYCDQDAACVGVDGVGAVALLQVGQHTRLVQEHKVSHVLQGGRGEAGGGGRSQLLLLRAMHARPVAGLSHAARRSACCC